MHALLFVGQCPVSQPTITPQVVCQISPPPSPGPSWGVSYTCNEPGNVVIWSGAVINKDFSVSHWSGVTAPALTIAGVVVTEIHTSDPTCINSTLIFHGQNLNALDGLALSCRYQTEAIIAIIIPRKSIMHAYIIFRLYAHAFTAAGLPGTINSAGIELTDFRCTNNRSIGHVSLEWTQPNGTGGQDLTIEHYVVNVTGPAEFTCPADQCNVTTTNTTITSLLCNTSYTVTVRAVNCIGEGNTSNPIIINSGLSHIVLVSSTLASSFTPYYYTPDVNSLSHLPNITATDVYNSTDATSITYVPLNVMATVAYTGSVNSTTDAISTTRSIQGKN